MAGAPTVAPVLSQVPYFAAFKFDENRPIKASSPSGIGIRTQRRPIFTLGNTLSEINSLTYRGETFHLFANTSRVTALRANGDSALSALLLFSSIYPTWGVIHPCATKNTQIIHNPIKKLNCITQPVADLTSNGTTLPPDLAGSVANHSGGNAGSSTTDL